MNTCLFYSEHVITQSYRCATNEAFQAMKGLCGIYTIWKLECCKCAGLRFHCANVLVVVRSCGNAGIGIAIHIRINHHFCWLVGPLQWPVGPFQLKCFRKRTM